MSATIPTRHGPAAAGEPVVAAGGGDADLREAAIANLKRKRKFVQDALGYFTVNGVLWLIWARRAPGWAAVSTSARVLAALHEPRLDLAAVAVGTAGLAARRPYPFRRGGQGAGRGPGDAEGRDRRAELVPLRA